MQWEGLSSQGTPPSRATLLNVLHSSPSSATTSLSWEFEQRDSSDFLNLLSFMFSSKKKLQESESLSWALLASQTGLYWIDTRTGCFHRSINSRAQSHYPPWTIHQDVERKNQKENQDLKSQSNLRKTLSNRKSLCQRGIWNPPLHAQTNQSQCLLEKSRQKDRTAVEFIFWVSKVFGVANDKGSITDSSQNKTNIKRYRRSWGVQRKSRRQRMKRHERIHTFTRKSRRWNHERKHVERIWRKGLSKSNPSGYEHPVSMDLLRGIKSREPGIPLFEVSSELHPQLERNPPYTRLKKRPWKNLRTLNFHSPTQGWGSWWTWSHKYPLIHFSNSS